MHSKMLMLIMYIISITYFALKKDKLSYLTPDNLIRILSRTKLPNVEIVMSRFMFLSGQTVQVFVPNVKTFPPSGNKSVI